MMKSKNSIKFDWKDFIKKLLPIAIPVALQNLLTTTASMIDTMMVAPLGELSVGALGLCAQYSSLMFSCYWGFVGGGLLFFAQYWGAKDDDGIKRSYGMVMTCLMSVAIIFAAMALIAPGTIMHIYTDKTAIQEIGVKYLRIVGIAYLLQVYSIGASTMLRATDQVKIPFYASVASVSTNIFLNWVFIYGHFGFPAMGIQGAALATTCAAFVNALVIVIAARAKGYPYLFALKGHFHWKKEYVALFLKKCFPIICNELAIGIGNMIFNITLGRQDEPVIAALAVFRTLEGLIIGFFAGFANASAILVGTPVGAGELRIAYERAKRLVYMCSGFIALVVSLLFTFRNPILTTMSLSGESLHDGIVIFGIFGLISIIRMGNWMMNDTYRAAGDAITGTVLEITFMYILLVPAVLLTGFKFHAPYWVVFLCCYIDEPIRYVIMQIHLYTGKWIRPVTDLGKKALPQFFEELNAKKESA